MSADVLRQAERAIRALKRCFVCGGTSSDTVQLSDPRMVGRSPAAIERGTKRRACAACVEGREGSLLATAAPDDPMLIYLSEYAPLLTLFPPNVARCMLGRHKHGYRLPFACLTDWRAVSKIRWRQKPQLR